LSVMSEQPTVASQATTSMPAVVAASMTFPLASPPV